MIAIRSLLAAVAISSASLLAGENPASAPPASEARALAEALLREFPDDPRALMALAGIEHRAGAVDRAIPLYREALRLDPALAGAREALGDILSQKGRAAEALLEYSAARPGPSGEGDDRARLRLKRALSLLALGRVPEAEGSLEEAVKTHPESGALRYLLAQTLLLRKDCAGALIQLEAARRLGEGRASVEYAISRAHFLSGNEKAGEEAIERFKAAKSAAVGASEARRLREESRSFLDRRNLALAHLDRASVYRRHGFPEKARKDLLQSISIDGELSAARLLLARLSEEMGDLDEASSQLEEILRSASDPAPWRKLAAALYIRRVRRLLSSPEAAPPRVPEALAWARRALELDPSAEGYETAAWASLAAGDRERGLECLREAARLDPGNPERLRKIRALEERSGPAR